jgi:hypothetical protein
MWHRFRFGHWPNWTEWSRAGATLDPPRLWEKRFCEACGHTQARSL